MKNITKLIILVLVLAILLAALWAIQSKRRTVDTTITRQVSAPFFSGLDSEKIFRIEITTLNAQQKESLILKKEAGVWQVAKGRDLMAGMMENTEDQTPKSTVSEESTDTIKSAGENETVPAPAQQEKPVDPRKDVGPPGDPYRLFFKADPEKVKAMVDAFVDMKQGQLVTANPDMKSQFKVLNILGVEVVLYDEQMNKLADLIVGNVGSDYQSTYVRKPDSDEIFQVPSRLQMTFETNLLMVRDRTVFTAAPETITSVAIKDTSAGTGLNLSRVEGAWQGTDSQGQKLEIGTKNVDDFLVALGSLSVSSFVDVTAPVNPAEQQNPEDPYGFMSPTFEITFTTSDNVTHSLIVGKKEGTVYYAFADGKTMDVFKISETTISTITPAADALKPSPEDQTSTAQPEPVAPPSAPAASPGN
jgi:hypothetical protein